MGYSKKYGFHFTDEKDYNKKWEEHNKEERSKYNKVRSADPEVKARKKITKKRWDEENREHKIQYNKEYYSDPKVKESRRIYRKKYLNGDKREEILLKKRKYASTVGREKHFMERYGITTEQRNNLILEQDNKCARCGLPFDLDSSGNTSNAPVVDHDHSYEDGDPNSIRAIIHNKCNTMIGMHNDSIEELEKSIEYLKKYGKKVV